MVFVLERPDGDVREVAVSLRVVCSRFGSRFWKSVGVDRFHRVAPMETTLRFLGHACVALLGERVQLLFEREAIGARNAQIDACLHAVMGEPRCFFD